MNANTNVIIREGSIEECLKISEQIPEFALGNYTEAVYRQRLSNKPHLILVAEIEKELVGFKVGYERYADRTFYSWLGGVIPSYRKLKVASFLANYQEEWAIENGYNAIALKTRNKFKNMLLFALKSGFLIETIEKKEDIQENRIVLRKKIRIDN